MKTFSTKNSENGIVKKYDLVIVTFSVLTLGLSFLLLSLLTGLTLSTVAATLAPTKLALIGFPCCVLALILDGFSSISAFKKY